MTSPARGAARLLRALALGFTCFALGLGSHVLAGGPSPSVLMGALVSVPLACVCLMVTAKRCELPTVTVVMVGAQLLLHQAFMWLADAPGCLPSPVPGGHMTDHGGGQLMMGCGGASMSGMAHGGAGLTPVMLTAHLVAALTAAVVLAHGERLLWEFARALVRPVVGLTRLPRLAAPPRALLAPYAEIRPTARVTSGPLSRRGPPQLVLATA